MEEEGGEDRVGRIDEVKVEEGGEEAGRVMI